MNRHPPAPSQKQYMNVSSSASVHVAVHQDAGTQQAPPPDESLTKAKPCVTTQKPSLLDAVECQCCKADLLEKVYYPFSHSHSPAFRAFSSFFVCKHDRWSGGIHGLDGVGECSIDIQRHIVYCIALTRGLSRLISAASPAVVAAQLCAMHACTA